MAITFQVSQVARRMEPLRMPAEGAPPELHEKPVEALGAGVLPFRPGKEHGLLEAVHKAYALHYPLVLSPDAIWLAIAQGFAMHVNANAERLRGKFVRHEGKATIRVRRDDFVKGSPANPWPEVFGAFSDAIAAHIGRQRDLVVCDFSTTGPCERAASEIVLLDAMKQYFRYELLTRCGIPEITLEGTVADWRSIRSRARALEEYELGWWTEGLGPVLDQLIAAAEGRVDVPFWKALFKPEGGSGGPYVRGWINVFFPYVKSGEPGEFLRNEMVTGWTSGLDAEFGGGANQFSIPSGLSCAPFDWLYYGHIYPMEFLGGFVGVAQDTETLALRPVIGWAVRDAVPRATARPQIGLEEEVEEVEKPRQRRYEGVAALIAGRISGSGTLGLEEIEAIVARVERAPTWTCTRSTSGTDLATCGARSWLRRRISPSPSPEDTENRRTE